VNRSCSNCGAELSSAAKFCRGCGAAVPAVPPVQQASAAPTAARTCGSCGGSLVNEARFCHLCGSATAPADSGDAPTTVLAKEPAGTLAGRTATPAFSSAPLAPEGGEAATIVSREPDPPPTSVLPAQPICPSCHAAVSAGARFCRACGAQLDVTAAGACPRPTHRRPLPWRQPRKARAARYAALPRQGRPSSVRSANRRWEPEQGHRSNTFVAAQRRVQRVDSSSVSTSGDPVSKRTEHRES
jgi:predicted amidophosphoribosyltransferase